MEKIIIVEIISTGFNFIEDCISRGYEPVILEVWYPEGEAADSIAEEREISYVRLHRNVRILRASSDYEETLAMVQAEAPLLVIPGSEYGVELATRLGDDLGLCGNSYRNIDKMCSKQAQQEALASAGLRCIQGRVTSSADEAAAFYDTLGTEDVVVKPLHGAGSVGVTLCHGKKEMLKAFHETQGTMGCLGSIETQMLIQRRIMGREYIVNTMSSHGKIMISSVWEYDKIRLDSGANVYRGSRLVTDFTPSQYNLVKYAFQVARALGIEYGPVHGEYIIDENGPVLIEANCRCMGSSFPAAYGDAVYGHHETDLALDAYLDFDRFDSWEAAPYAPMKYAITKDLIARQDTDVSSSPIIQFLPGLKSYFTSYIQTAANVTRIKKTVDLITSPGTIFLCHEDQAVVEKDYELLCTLEKDYFELIHTKYYDGRFVLNGKTLSDLEDVFFEFRTMTRNLADGECLHFSEEQAAAFPYGLSGLVMIMRIFGLKLMPPRFNQGDVLLFRK